MSDDTCSFSVECREAAASLDAGVPPDDQDLIDLLERAASLADGIARAQRHFSRDMSRCLDNAAGGARRSLLGAIVNELNLLLAEASPSPSLEGEGR